MRLFKKILSKLFRQFRVNISRVAPNGFALTVVLLLVSGILFANIFRVLDNGVKNYNVYRSEVQGLEEERARNQQLSREFQIVTSDEYLMLLARDVLNLVRPGETIFTTKPTQNFYEVKVNYLNPREKESFLDWWLLLM